CNSPLADNLICGAVNHGDGRIIWQIHKSKRTFSRQLKSLRMHGKLYVRNYLKVCVKSDQTAIAISDDQVIGLGIVTHIVRVIPHANSLQWSKGLSVITANCSVSIARDKQPVCIGGIE